MSTTKETLLTVSGMTCPSCVRHVESALREIAGVRGVEVHLREGKVLVKHDAEGAPATELVEALREAGYESALGAAA
jgi:copper chaperone